MFDIICALIFIVILCSAIGVIAAISYSEPAPDWYEEEEWNRRNWYK